MARLATGRVSRCHDAGSRSRRRTKTISRRGRVYYVVTYHHLSPEDVEPIPGRSATTRSASDHAGFDLLGLRFYEAAPGEQLPKKYHYHEKQEEGLYVIEGTLHVDTPEGEYIVEPGEAFVVEPGNPHRAHNPEDATETVRVFAAGAPSDDGGIAYDPDE